MGPHPDQGSLLQRLEVAPLPGQAADFPGERAVAHLSACCSSPSQSLTFRAGAEMIAFSRNVPQTALTFGKYSTSGPI